MTALWEKPVLIGFLGIVTALVLGFGWLQTGRKPAFYGAIVALIVTVLGVAAATFIVTDREAVHATLLDAAAAVERNDLDTLLGMVHSEADGIRQQASAELPQYKFTSVQVKSNLEITFDDPDEPQEAVAKFNVVVVGSDRHGLITDRRVPRYCEVTFRKEEGVWRVVSYTHDDPREGLLQR